LQLIARHTNAMMIQTEPKEIEVGVARYATNPDGESCEFAIVIADNMHGKGLGNKLMTALMDAAREKGLKVMQVKFKQKPATC